MNGLHYKYFPMPLHFLAISDAGHATKKSSYPYEGKLVLLMEDKLKNDDREFISDKSLFEGSAHVIYFSARRATRISHSTSHAETLASVGTAQVANLATSRITELFARQLMTVTGELRAQHLLKLHTDNCWVIPVDQITDCMDLFELVTNLRGLSSDKSQRLAIMALREDRMAGRTRYFQHWPTRCMVADGLTKSGIFMQLLGLITTGILRMPLAEQRVRLRKRAPCHEYTERDLENLDW